jgi:phenylacetate-coenzyme A ligase PaaK-like adenylate-forming protein
MTDDLSFFTRLSTMARVLARNQTVLARERWSRDQLDAYQRRRLATLVAEASARSPFYKAHYGGSIGEREVELHRLPPVSKAAWMEAFDNVVVDRALRLADVEAHLTTIRGDRLYRGEYRIMASSGTTGRRGVYVWNQRDWLDLLGIIMRPTQALGIRPRVPRPRVALIGAPDAKHMTYRVGASMDAGVSCSLRLGVTQPLADIVAALQRFQPDVLSAYPSMAAMLAAEQRAGRLHISPRAISTSSELRTDEMTRAIREVWGVEPRNVYALTETGLAAWTCPEANALHACEDSCILESVDDDGREVPAGQPGSRLLVTSLLNHTQPVIRLEVSDQLTFAREPCACGRTLRVIEVMHGRADDILDLPCATGGRIALHPMHLRSPLAAVREVISYQITQRPRELDVQVVLAAPNANLPLRLAEQITAVLRARDVADFPVRVRAVEAIARASGAGKLKLVEVVRDAPQERPASLPAFVASATPPFAQRSTPVPSVPR